MSQILSRTFLRIPLKPQVRYLVQKNDLASKYAQQLQKKAEKLGLRSVEELKEKLLDEISEKKKAMNSVDPLAELEEYERKQAEELRLRQAKQKQQGSSKIREAIDSSTPKQPYKTLDSFLDLDKVKSLPKAELQYIWRARFANQERSLHATLEAPQFAGIFANAFKNPSFVLPLPKDGEGYEMHFVQWAFVGPHTTHCLLTSLAEYKLHKEYAKPHTTLMFHQELVSDSGIVLMNGRVEDDVPLTMDEAQLLLLNVQRFYGGMANADSSQRKLKMLRAFTLGDSSFDMEKLIEEAALMD